MSATMVTGCAEGDLAVSDAGDFDDDEFEDVFDDDDDDAIVPDDFDDDDDDADEEDDDYEDATADEIDFVIALYREDGQPVAMRLAPSLANDLDELIDQLRRLPGDAGALGAVSIAQEFFVLCRVRGRNVQVLLNDSGAAADWPIARDVADYLGLDVPDPDEEPEVWGDAEMLVDQGVGELDLEAVASEPEDSDDLVRQLAGMLKFGPQFERALAGRR